MIPDKSIDMILCDLPYGTTACKWDTIIPFDKLWEQYNRIIRDGGIVVLFGSQPFTTQLINSNIENFKYELIWEKEQGINFPLAKKQPLKSHENICVFFQTPTDNTENRYQDLKEYMIGEKEKTGLKSKEINTLLKNYMSSHYFTRGTQFTIPKEEDYIKLQSTGYFKKEYPLIKEEYEKGFNTYNPQMEHNGKGWKSGSKSKIEVYGGLETLARKTSDNEYRYPKSVMRYNREYGLHPTQKPVALFEYLIKTYTNEGELVLDNCMGSGTTAVAAARLNRQFLGFERESEYVRIANQRLEAIQDELAERKLTEE
jgi:DNA modification methylase